MSHSLETSNLNETSINIFRKILVKTSSTHTGFLFPSAGERMLQGRLTGYLTLCGLRREPRILRASELCLHTASNFANHRRGPWETTTHCTAGGAAPKAGLAAPLPVQVTQGKVKEKQVLV